jgi:hypothetical protein
MESTQTIHYGDNVPEPKKRETKESGVPNHVKLPLPGYRVENMKDEKLPEIKDDPREDSSQRITKKASSRGNGCNTESLDPTLPW